MPFKSESQVRKCYALKSEGQAGSWNCDEWKNKTKSIKALPERVKKAMLESFTKIAKELFNPSKSPSIPTREIQKQEIQALKEEKTKGLSLIKYRNELTAKRTGIIQKNKESNKAI
jgi:hypothetical protein